MARARGISVVVSGNTAPLRKSLRDANQELTAFGKAQAKWSQASTLAYSVAGSAAAQFAIDSVKAAIEDQKSQALLAKQLQVTTGARQAQIDGVEAYIEATMMATNVTDDQLRPALAQLVRVTGSASEAQKLLTLATDVSVGANRDLSSVVTALSRAYGGNAQGLTRLGITIDKTEVSARGFAAVTDELTEKFGGAAAAAADTTAGRIQNLGVRFDELKETIGTGLLPVIEDFLGGLADIAEGIQGTNVRQLGKGLFDLGTEIGNLAQTITGVGIAKSLSPFGFVMDRLSGKSETLADKMKALSDVLVQDAAIYAQSANLFEDQADAAARADREVGYLRDTYRSLSEVTLQLAADEKRRAEQRARDAADAGAQRKQAAADYRAEAKDLRTVLGRALEDSRKNLDEARRAAVEFGESLATSFGVNLSAAYDRATDSEDAYATALEARKTAYEGLNMAKAGDDLNSYLRAVEDVRRAEEGVTAAQAARVSPAAAFKQQINDARTFAQNLQALLGQGLTRAGLQQLLDLGPTAGAQVTKELLAGTAGFTVSELESNLAALAGVQASLASGITARLAPTGAMTSAQAQIDALSAARIGAPGVGQGFTININAGVGDPIAIGREVKKVLADYDTRAGSLVVQGPKKKK